MVGLSQDSSNTLPNGFELAEFKLVQRIGEGGFSIVYLAQDTSLDAQVAIKEYMPSSLASRANDRTVAVKSDRYLETFNAGMRSFINEAKLLRQFEHPSVVKVYRFFEANGTAYMVMPFYQGQTFKQILKDLDGPPDEAWLKAMLAPIVDALELIHNNQCFHRDIAPDNIMILEDGRPLLIDFGAARRVIGDMTQALTAILKPGFAPIEQYADIPGIKQGAWTDLYALAGVIHYALVGKAPVPSVARIVTDSMIPLTKQLEGKYSEQFLSGIDAALKVRPEERTQSAAQMREALGLVSDQRPVYFAASGGGVRLAGALSDLKPTTVQLHNYVQTAGVQTAEIKTSDVKTAKESAPKEQTITFPVSDVAGVPKTAKLETGKEYGLTLLVPNRFEPTQFVQTQLEPTPLESSELKLTPPESNPPPEPTVDVHETASDPQLGPSIQEPITQTHFIDAPVDDAYLVEPAPLKEEPAPQFNAEDSSLLDSATSTSPDLFAQDLSAADATVTSARDRKAKPTNKSNWPLIGGGLVVSVLAVGGWMFSRAPAPAKPPTQVVTSAPPAAVAPDATVVSRPPAQIAATSIDLAKPIDPSKTATQPTAPPADPTKPEDAPPLPTSMDAKRFAAILQARAANNLAINLVVPQKVLAIGRDSLKLSVKPAFDGFLYVFLAGTTGELTQLYPNGYEANNKVQAGVETSIPPKGSPYGFTSSGPAGRDTIVVMVSVSERDFTSVGALKQGSFETYNFNKMLETVLAKGTAAVTGTTNCPEPKQASCEVYGLATIDIDVVKSRPKK